VIQVPTTDQTQNGVVVDEEPQAGSRAPAGSEITISVGTTG
jgi:beta-lactam-binding protein with PASTA domain